MKLEEEVETIGTRRYQVIVESFIGGYWSRPHIQAVCFSGFSAMLDLNMGGCQGHLVQNCRGGYFVQINKSISI